MQTFDQHLLKHLQSGRITYEEAMRTATSPHDFKLMVAAGGPINQAPAEPDPEDEFAPAMQASLTPSAPSGPPPPSAPPPGVPR
jgi:twitching motility protein PilT